MHHHQRSVKVSQLFIAAAWGAVAAMVLGAWALHWLAMSTAVLVGLTACAMSAGVAVYHVRVIVHDATRAVVLAQGMAGEKVRKVHA